MLHNSTSKTRVNALVAPHLRRGAPLIRGPSHFGPGSAAHRCRTMLRIA